MENWEDVFKLKKVSRYEFGGFSSIGGDPESADGNPDVYMIVDKRTGERINLRPFPEYTAKYYAGEAFKELQYSMDNILTGNE